MTEPKLITLDTLADGAAAELFRRGWEQVVENIGDVNTDPEAKRVITLQITVSADQERKHGAVELKCSTKLAGIKGVQTGVYFGKHLGAFTAVEAARQEDMFTQPAGGPRAVPAPANGGA